jgi:hypothetical protein
MAMNRLDPAIRSLFDRLPPPGSIWARTERRAWLRAMEYLFEVIYQSEERRDDDE